VKRRLARARRVPGVMNKLEKEYADLFLGKLVHFYEAVTLKLGDDCRYTPDFMVIAEDDVIEFREVKGRWMDDAKVKIRVAAEKFPMFRFEAWSKVNKIWTRQKFGLEDAA
jgi:hypothetical protein